MNVREVAKQIRALDRLEREEIRVLETPIREKYNVLRKEVQMSCEHFWQLQIGYGVMPWDEWWVCGVCKKMEHRVNEDIKEAHDTNYD